MSVPESHPSVDEHEHKGLSCPGAGATHNFCPAQKGDSRSPCPALNTMANHGYIARDGKNLSPLDLVRGMKECYGLSNALSYFLSFTTYLLLWKFRRIALYEIGEHGNVEHNASLVHHDTPKGQAYAPIEIDQDLVDLIVNDAQTTVEVEVEVNGSQVTQKKTLLTAADVGRSRVRREKDSPRLSILHAEIARGEMAIILGVWETKVKDKFGVPVEWIKRWLGEERLPDGWKPDHVEGFHGVVQRAKAIRLAAAAVRKAEREQDVQAASNLDVKAKL